MAGEIEPTTRRPRRGRWFLFGLAGLLMVAVGGIAAIEWTPWTPVESFPSGAAWQSQGKIQVEAEFPWLALQFYDGFTLWATEHKYIYTSADLGRSWALAGRLCPKSAGARQAIMHELGASNTHRILFRPSGISSLLVLRSDTVLAYCAPHIYRSNDHCVTFEIVHTLRQDPEPKRVHRNWCEDAAGAVYYGEYGLRRLADSRVVGSRDDGRTWQTIYTFPCAPASNSVRHIHAVQFDEYSGRIWVATGDKDAECRIGYLDSDSRFITIGTGGQQWRTCTLLFTKDYVFWGADAPGGPCGVFRWSRSDRQLQKVADLHGPVLFSQLLGDGTLVVSTEIEGLGSGYVAVWFSRDGTHWESSMRLEKPPDREDEGLFATLGFPLGKPTPAFLFNMARLEDVRYSSFRAAILRNDRDPPPSSADGR